jgi:hypothetical protein
MLSTKNYKLVRGIYWAAGIIVLCIILLLVPTSRQVKGAEQVIYPFHVYCIRNKVEISRRELSEIQWTRGYDVCLKQRSETLSAAIDMSEILGGDGSSCDCGNTYDDEKERRKIHPGSL